MGSENSEIKNGQRPENGRNHGNRKHGYFNKNRNFKPNRNQGEAPSNIQAESSEVVRKEAGDSHKDNNGFNQRRNDNQRFNRPRFEKRGPQVETKEDIMRDCEHIESQIMYEINDIKTINTSLF